jgi:hypothetical protein
MNAHFVNIKVDREERPDIDSIYMTAVQAMTGSGGWPMTVFLTPDGVPFYGGTYFPPEDRYGMPSFQRLLAALADAWQNRRAELLKNGDELVAHIRQATAAPLPEGSVAPAVLDEAYAVLHGQFEPDHGGFGRVPKFPQPMTLEFLLRYSARTGTSLGVEMLGKTLRAMAEGGMYDQLGGGFHRYSVDEQWLVPHFEKMLYDNALLARTYLETYQATGEPLYRRVAEETLDYLLREMRHEQGGFFSTQDADSLPHWGGDHKEEGAFFVWTPEELRETLGQRDAMVFAALFDVTDKGNFEGRSILHVTRTPAEVARVTGMPAEHVQVIAERGRQALFAAREQRPKPARDEKILVAWNGMAIRAFAHAAVVLGRDDYREAAQACASFVQTTMRLAPDAPLHRSWKDGRLGATRAFLEDYALFADGLLALYEATFDPQWVLTARELADTILADFWDDGIQGFYDTAADHEQLVVRPRDTGDNATPSGSSVAADVLLRLAVIFDQPLYRERAEVVLGSMVPFMQRYPTGFGRYLTAAEFALFPLKEIALVGDLADPALQTFADATLRPFLPGKVVLHTSGAEPPALPSPLLAERPRVNGQATAYVCENYACRLPVTDVEALREQLGVVSL